MTRFILRRLLLAIPVLIGIVFLVFAARAPGPGRSMPGGPRRARDGRTLRCSSVFATGSTSRSPIQFVIYLGDLASGDLGTSIKHSRAVTTLLIERLPDDHRADDLRPVPGHRHRRAARAGVGHQAQLGRRRVDHGLRQPRRVDPRLRARPAARLSLRDRAQGHALRAAAIRTAELRRHRRCRSPRSGAWRT